MGSDEDSLCREQHRYSFLNLILLIGCNDDAEILHLCLDYAFCHSFIAVCSNLPCPFIRLVPVYGIFTECVPEVSEAAIAKTPAVAEECHFRCAGFLCKFLQRMEAACGYIRKYIIRYLFSLAILFNIAIFYPCYYSFIVSSPYINYIEIKYVCNYSCRSFA